MYSEMTSFARHMMRENAMWRDGEFWTSVVGGVAVSIWVYQDPTVAEAFRSHFADILTIAGIVFGFVLGTLAFYVDKAGEWSANSKVERVAQRIVDWQVWTVLSLLVLVGYVVVLWAASRLRPAGPRALSLQYGALAFLAIYPGLQILNHTLTVWWTFRHRQELQTGTRAPKGGTQPRDPGRRVDLLLPARLAVGGYTLAFIWLWLLQFAVKACALYSLLAIPVVLVGAFAALGVYGYISAWRRVPERGGAPEREIAGGPHNGGQSGGREHLQLSAKRAVEE